MDNKNAVLIWVADNYPKELYDFLEEEFANSPLAYRIDQRESGAMAGIEWALPTAIVAYLLKPFFEAFLQEAGKDAYLKTKEGIKKLVKKNLPVETIRISANSSPHKLSERYDQSGAISLKVAVHKRLTFTVLFSNEIEPKEFDLMLDGLFKSIEQIYLEVQKNFPDETDGEQISHNELYLLANVNQRSWEILTEKQMLERYRNVN